MANLNQALGRMIEAGVNIRADDGKLIAESNAPLTDRQRGFIKSHKTELLKLLASAPPPSLTTEEHKGIQEAIDERAAIREYEAGEPRCVAEHEARKAMRVYRYRLTTSKGWCTLVAPGWSPEDAERDLRGRYEERFIELVKHIPQRQKGVVSNTISSRISKIPPP